MKKCLPKLSLQKLQESIPCQFAENLSAAIKGRDLEQPMNLIIFVESAVGLLNLADVCRRGDQLHQQGAPFRLEGIVFGSDDFVADIGILILFVRVLMPFAF